MDLNSAVEKYYLSNVINDVQSPGIFVFDDLSYFIKNNIKQGNNFGVERFINEIKNKYKERLDYFLPIIIYETREPENKIVEKIEKRLKNTYYGIFAESILEKMYDSSQMYEVLELNPFEDYSHHIDLKVRDRTDNSVLLFQIKTIKYLTNPSPYQTHKLEKEKQVHKDRNLNVVYAFFNHDFENRYFIFDNYKLPIFGYGSRNVPELEKITFELFNTHNQRSREEQMNSLVF